MNYLHRITADTARYFILAFVLILAIVYYGRIDYSSEPYNNIPDLKEYIKMAEGSPSLSHQVRQPFCYRILGPYIAGLLPFRTDISFSILAVGLTFVLVYLFYMFLLQNQISRTVAFFTTLLLIVNKYIIGYMLWDCYQVDDLLSYIFILLLLLAVMHKKWLWYGVLMCVSVLARETNLILALVAFVYILEKELPRSDTIKQIGFTLPAVIVLFLVRIYIIPADGSLDHSTAQFVGGLTSYFHKIFSLQTWYRIICNVYTPVSLIPFICYTESYRFLRDNKFMLALMVLFIASSFFANDIERLVSPGFPAFYLLIAIIFQKNFLNDRKLMIIVVLFAVLAIPHHMYSRFPLPERNLTIFFSVTSLCLTSLTIIISCLMKKSHRGAQDNTAPLP